MKTLVPLLCALPLALTPLVGCDASGSGGDGSAAGQVAAPQEETLFDGLFGGSGTKAESDQTASGAANCTPDAPCDPTEPAPDPGGSGGSGTPAPEPVLECSSPLASPTGAATACAGLCQTMAGCLGGGADAVAACTQDCAASLSGVELAAAEALFACFVDAGCEALEAWVSDDGGGATTEPAPPPTDPAPMPDGGGSGSGGSDGGGEVPVPAPDGGDGGGAEPPVPVDGTEASAAWAIEQCLYETFASWSGAGADPAKAAWCQEAVTQEGACDDVAVSGGGSTGSAGGSGSGSGGAEPPPPQDGSGGFAPDPDGGADPMPPEDAGTEGDGDLEECYAMATLLQQPALDRVAHCLALPCEDQQACLDDVLACVPFIESLFGPMGGSATASGGVANPEPVDGTPTDPVPEPQ